MHTYNTIDAPPSFDLNDAGIKPRTYTSEPREDEAVAIFKSANGYDVSKLRQAEYM